MINSVSEKNKTYRRQEVKAENHFGGKQPCYLQIQML